MLFSAGLQVDTGVTLTINPGTRVHLHADAPFVVDGTLIANGTKKGQHHLPGRPA